MLWLYTPKKVIQLASFTAPDPWNENKSSTFRLDQCFDGGVVPAYAALEETSIPHRFAIRSQAEKQHRVLPDSLAAIWKSNKLPAEALPARLKDLEPTLKRSDYFRLATMNPMQRAIRIWAAPVFGVFLIVLGVALFNSGSGTEGAILLLAGLLAIAIPLAIFAQLNRRRKEPTEWALGLTGAAKSASAGHSSN